MFDGCVVEKIRKNKVLQFFEFSTLFEHYVRFLTTVFEGFQDMVDSIIKRSHQT